MRNYPIDSNVKGFIAMEIAIKLINAAFYDGFMTAILETPEELDSLTVGERIECMALANKMNDYITRSGSYAGGGKPQHGKSENAQGNRDLKCVKEVF